MKAKYMVGKVNMFDLTSNVGYRATDHVFHEDGYKVASDGLILLAIQDKYGKHLEGKCLTQEGEIKEMRYPKWRSVIPCEQSDFNKSEWVEVPICLEELEGWVKTNRQIAKDVNGKGKTWDDSWKVYAGRWCVFNAKSYYHFAKAATELGADKFYIPCKPVFSHAAFAKTDRGWALRLPLLYSPEEFTQRMDDGEIDVFFLSYE